MSKSIGLIRRWARQWFTTKERLPEVGRNDLCWCGSGKKYKRCHMIEDQRRGTLTPNQTPNVQKQIGTRGAKRAQAKSRGK